jgi:hypothetical protein
MLSVSIAAVAASKSSNVAAKNEFVRVIFIWDTFVVCVWAQDVPGVVLWGGLCQQQSISSTAIPERPLKQLESDKTRR